MIDEDIYERAEVRHNWDGHRFAEYPDECYVCEQQAKEDES